VSAYGWPLGSIWGVWFAAYVAACVYADVSANGNAAVIPYLVMILGGMAAIVLSVVVIAAIAYVQCADAYDRRRRST
jgi:hypothetical protein